MFVAHEGKYACTFCFRIFLYETHMSPLTPMVWHTLSNWSLVRRQNPLRPPLSLLPLILSIINIVDRATLGVAEENVVIGPPLDDVLDEV